MKLLEMSHVKKSFGELDVLKDISLNVEEGEVVAIIGPSGSGKSTLLRCATLLETMDEGSLTYCGQNAAVNENGRSRYASKKELHDIKENFGLVFQNFNLFPHYSVLKNITDAPVHVQKRDMDEVTAEAKKLLAKVGLEGRESSYPWQLSGGQQQRLCIARALAVQPEVLLMDEPLSNLDAKLRNQMRAEIIKLRQRIDTTFIYVTHDQTEAMTLGDRIVIMRDGEIQQVGTPQEVFDHPANLFVAGFIGMPRMNTFDAQLQRDPDGKYAVQLENAHVVLSDEKQARLAEKNVQPGRIVLGIRPEHIMLAGEGEQMIHGTVDVSEMMGSAVHLHLQACGRDTIIIVQTMSMQGATNSSFGIGQSIAFTFGGNVVHVFDPETGKNLEF